MQSKIINSKFDSPRLRVALLAMLGLTAVIFFASRHSRRSQVAPQSPLLTAQVSTTDGVYPSTLGVKQPTVGWKTTTDNRGSHSLTYKHPPDWPADWTSASTFCAGPSPEPTDFDLPANCLKIRIWTDRLSGLYIENAVLTSETQLSVSGHKAKRELYTYQNGGYNYSVELYESNQPFALLSAYIAPGTDARTYAFFISTLDAVVDALQISRN